MDSAGTTRRLLWSLLAVALAAASAAGVLRLVRAAPPDLFPQTAHFEVVATFTR